MLKELTKQNLFLAFLSGLLLGFSWPSDGFTILIFFAFIPLLIAEKNIRDSHKPFKSLKAFLLAYFAFMIWHLLSVSWIAYASVLGMVFIVVLHSFFLAILFLGYHLSAKNFSTKFSLLFLITLWICFEKLDLEWELSLPWLNLGNVFSENIVWIQWYEYTGTFGGTLWIWVTNAIFFLGFKNRIPIRKTLSKVVLLICVPILISLLIFVNYQENGDSVNAKILQPNIDPYTEKYNFNNWQSKDIILDMAQPVGDTDIIVAPETFLPYGLRTKYLQDNPILKDLKNNINTASFIGGVVLKEKVFQEFPKNEYSYQVEKNQWQNHYNSALFIHQTDSIKVYHKSKPLVGVESIPYQQLFEGLLFDFGGEVASITPQNERSVFTTDCYSIAPIICYESIYGDFVSQYVKNGANLLAIITNDGWWGNSQGHKQHFSYAKLRAIETRRSIIRSANTGISAIINQKGETELQIPYGKKASCEGTLKTNTYKTFYVKYGDYIPRIAVLYLLISISSIYYKKTKHSKLS